MEVLIFLVVLVGCGAYVVYAFKQADTKSLDISYTQTTPLKDAIDIFKTMLQTDSGYRHYVEIKGTAHGDRILKAPFSSQDAIFYSNKCFSVTQETHVSYDSKGHKHTRTTKSQHELSSETSSDVVSISDSSSSERVCIDLQSFESAVDLTSACDRFEQKNSPFATTYFSGYHGGSNFLGFRLKESILREGQPLYILGELYQMGNTLYLGKAHQAGKTSLLSVKSEDQILHDVKKEKFTALALAAGVLVIAIFILF